MLEIKNIKKTYKTDDFIQKALDNVSINFRQNEFVSILGPSGSGKTTLLNIIGGLDHYDSGDLIINGTSTKHYKDKDWDNYRNCRVGFVFQSYNLISHQTILFNIELALTLSGISKKERKKRAIEALDKVGLSKHMNKKPNQLSGGQMQRVAIARALVNDPDILLADEPTGALDSKTSTQIMSLLESVAKDRLVIMVTHNEKLAKKYSTRIIKLLDGVIVGDTDKYTAESDKNDLKNLFRKASMSFITALQLSFSNLNTKRGRTILVSFAGSIGIVGIALILSLSNGVNNYIARIQEETLSSYPFTIEQKTADITGAIASIMGNTKKSDSSSGVKEIQIAAEMFAQVGNNDLSSFKSYLDENENIVEEYTNSLEYNYGIEPQLYSYDTTKISRLNPSDMFSTLTNSINSSMVSTSFYTQMIDNRDLLKEQYNVLAGSWPKNYNEVVLVLSDEHSMSDVMTYVLGLRSQEEFSDMMKTVMEGKAVENKNIPLEWTYDELLNIRFKMILPTDYYEYDSKFKVWTDMSDDEEYLRKKVENGVDVVISGIISQKESTVAGSLGPGISYTKELIEYIIKESSKTDIVMSQLKNEDIDVFSGKKFEDIEAGDNKTGLDFQDMISVDEEALKSAFGMEVDENELKNAIASSIKSMTDSVSTDIDPATKSFNDALTNLFVGLVNSNIDATTYASFNMDNLSDRLDVYFNSDAAKNIIKPLEKEYGIPTANLSAIFKSTISGIMNGTITTMGGSAYLNEIIAIQIMENSLSTPQMIAASKQIGSTLTETKIKIDISKKASNLSTTIISSMTSGIKVDTDAFSNAFKFDLDEDELTRIITALLTSSSDEMSSDINLRKLGYSSYDEPIRISIYFKDFESKESFKGIIDKYNDSVTKSDQEDKVINYTDITGILMSSVTNIVDIVSYVLIAFVSVSLVVSSIMIGIITYISVLERTKEIGILRSIGASKKDISRVFNAETVIIGFCAGLFGIIITYLLDIVANIILLDLTKVPNLAHLPMIDALILITISIVLTFIAGLIPARIASNKDPVEALRTE